MSVAVAPRRPRPTPTLLLALPILGLLPLTSCGRDAMSVGPGDEANGDEQSLGGPIVGALDISVWSLTSSDSEVDCWWQQGIRHVVVGTQYLEVTRQQLQVASRGGMSVDLYAYIYWQDSMRDQVQEALDLAKEFPQVGRIWLDIEESNTGHTVGQPNPRPPLPRPLTPDELIARIQEGLDVCGDFPCGIYSGSGWWQSFVEDRPAFTHVPLWYARYDGLATFSTWATKDHFGGWSEPPAKQYLGKQHFCGTPSDLNIWREALIAKPPQVVLDRTALPQTFAPAKAPSDLLPDDGFVVHTEYVKPTAMVLRDATSYDLELQFWARGVWKPYFVFSQAASSRTITPQLADTAYRFRVRGKNARGAGPWSGWAYFLFGNVANPPTAEQARGGGVPPVDAGAPDAGTPVDAGAPDAGSPADAGTPFDAGTPVPGAPVPLAPANGSQQSGPNVLLTASAVSGATAYQFEIQTRSGGTLKPYYTYNVIGPTQTFYPQVHGLEYVWRVRVTQGTGGPSPWSTQSSFYFP